VGAPIQTPPSSGTGSAVSAALDLFNVLHEPTAVFHRVNERPRVLIPWLGLGVLLILTAVLTQPFQAAAFEAFKSSLTPEQAARMGNRGAGGGPVGFVLYPVMVFIGVAAATGLLWIGVALTGSQGRYKTLLSVLTYACVTFVLFSVVSVLVLNVRGVQAVTGFQDLRAPLGLDLLVPGAGFYAGAVLNGINPFSIWGVWLTGTGIAVTHKTSRGTAIAVAAGAYLIMLLLVSLPALFAGMMTRQ
jgi:Yip1-like protein